MVDFESSLLWAKLRCILWIPLIAETKSINVQDRVIGEAILWQPSQDERSILEQDFNEIMELIVTGNIERLSAQVGQYLHVRPKALDSSKKTYTIDENGYKVITSPRGFYLRTQLTSKIIK